MTLLWEGHELEEGKMVDDTALDAAELQALRQEITSHFTLSGQLADMSKVLALCVLYRVSETANSATGCACEPRKRTTACDHGISRFRVRRVWPPPPKEEDRHWKVMTPEEFRDRLREVRMAHIDTEHRLWDGDAA
jgi:hypothetical protein